MGHAFGFGLQGCVNDRVSLGLIVVGFDRVRERSPKPPRCLARAPACATSCTVGRLTCNCPAIAALSCPARAAKIIRQRSATCCGVPCEVAHCFSCVCSAASNLIARLVFGTTRIIAIAHPQSYLRDTTLVEGSAPSKWCSDFRQSSPLSAGLISPFPPAERTLTYNSVEASYLVEEFAAAVANVSFILWICRIVILYLFMPPEYY